MSKIYACLFTSVDGCAAAPETWHFPFINDQLMAAVLSQYAAADSMMLGRQTYAVFAFSWGFRAQTDPLCAAINSLHKYVVSNTMHQADWGPATLLSGDLVDAVNHIKQAPGGDVIVPGSVSLIRSPLRLCLLDELQLMVHPVVLGTGQPLFDHTVGRHPLRLVSSETFTTGVHHNTYTPSVGVTDAG